MAEQGVLSEHYKHHGSPGGAWHPPIVVKQFLWATVHGTLSYLMATTLDLGSLTSFDK